VEPTQLIDPTLQRHQEPRSCYSLTPLHGSHGLALALDGRSDQAIDHIQQAMRMSPCDPQTQCSMWPSLPRIISLVDTLKRLGLVAGLYDSARD